MVYRVTEIFKSIEGEGKRTGLQSTFIRLAGCNLRCTYCDTPYSMRFDDGVNFDEEAVFLCGKRYREHVMPFFHNSTAPLASMGIGKQLKYLNDRLA